MGGQVSDTGELITSAGRKLPVTGAVKQGRTCYLSLLAGAQFQTPDQVKVEMDVKRRRLIEANHAATHLLHWALHQIVGNDVTQKGSYVGPEYLRFDFNSNALSPAQVRSVEQLVNRQVASDDEVAWRELPYEEVKHRSNIMQFFGEKYGASVRVVQIGGTPGQLGGYSMEFCGGTHLRRTGANGLFVIGSAAAIPTGVCPGVRL